MSYTSIYVLIITYSRHVRMHKLPVKPQAQYSPTPNGYIHVHLGLSTRGILRKYLIHSVCHFLGPSFWHWKGFSVSFSWPGLHRQWQYDILPQDASSLWTMYFKKDRSRIDVLIPLAETLSRSRHDVKKILVNCKSLISNPWPTGSVWAHLTSITGYAW